jgi:hypothetical protein
MTALALVWMVSAPRPAWGQWTGGPTGPIYYSGGNVGIGTATPGATLDISRTANDSGVILGLGNGGAPYWQFARSAGTGALSIQGTQTGYNNLLLSPTGGNVGIGTSNPQYPLSVNGQIGAKDVIVTNTGWSDYVFQPGYRLRPLSEVNAYIEANHHLPDIPSEAEVQEKGVSVGDMQSKLLAKIEELTLHMIQQDKENRDLRERIAQLEAHAAGVPSGPGAPATGR